MNSDEKLYSTKEAAQFLSVSVITLKRWKKSGKLVPKEIGIIQRQNWYKRGD